MLQPALPRDALAALSQKYSRLIALRAQRDATPHTPTSQQTKAQLKTLAGMYPGCLRELDRLSLPSLLARQAAVAQALAGAIQADWMIWIWGYHRLLAAGLAHKGGRAAPPENTWPEVTRSFLQQALSPPAGRISQLVVEELSRQVEQPPSIVAATLFPPRTAT